MMPMVSSLLRTAGLLLFMVGLAACHSVPRRPAPLHPPPVASDRFVLSSPEQTVVGELQVVIAGPNDTLPELARRFNLGYEEIVAANPGVSIESPRGMRIVLPTQFILPHAPRQGIVINLATLRLFYFPPPTEPGGPQEVITHPIGIGREGWSTPLGKAQIVRKVAGPTWNVPDSIRREHAAQGDRLPGSVPPGPDNPLGTHALYLSWPRYLVHGTNKPGGIGMRVSHGCIQLYPEDITPLYEQIKVPTPVYVVNQPMLAGWHGGMLYLDAHPPLGDDGRNWRKGVRTVLKAEAAKGEAGKAGVEAVDWDKVNRLVAKPRGIPVPVLVGAPPLETVLANIQVVENSVPEGANYQREEPSIPSVRRAGLSQINRN
ncbi:MAG: L,D-transpeptidase family protein [Candidatus Competibacteraceae bacterium]